MSQSRQSLVVFSVDGRSFALDIAAVERVYRCVEISPLPGAPPGVRGVINVRGTILPVFDLRAQLALPPREPRSSDHLIVARTSWRTVALLVDTVSGVVPREQAPATPAASILPGLKSVTEAITIGTEIVLVQDLDGFLSMEERDALQLTLQM